MQNLLGYGQCRENCEIQYGQPDRNRGQEHVQVGHQPIEPLDLASFHGGTFLHDPAKVGRSRGTAPPAATAYAAALISIFLAGF